MGGAGTSGGPGHPDDPPQARRWGPGHVRGDLITTAPPAEPAQTVEELALTGLRRALTAVNVEMENVAREVVRATEALQALRDERARLAERSRVLSDAIDGMERTEPLQETAAQGAGRDFPPAA